MTTTLKPQFPDSHAQSPSPLRPKESCWISYVARASDKETGEPAKIKHEETMISLREWPTDGGQIKLRRGIWLLVVLNCSLKPFSFPCCHLNLSPRYLTLSRVLSAVFALTPRAPCYLKLNRKTEPLIM